MKDLDLETYAAVCAELAEGDARPGAVLAARGLDDGRWGEIALDWGRRLTAGASEGEEATLAMTFSAAFAKAQDAKRPLPAMDAEGWGIFVADVDHLGLARALAVRRFSLADHSRLVRHWAKALAIDPALYARFEHARDAREASLLA